MKWTDRLSGFVGCVVAGAGVGDMLGWTLRPAQLAAVIFGGAIMGFGIGIAILAWVRRI